MEKATQFIQKQKEKILETVGINPKIRPDSRLETVKAKLDKLEAIVGVLRKNFVRHSKCVREMTESAFLIAQDTQQFYQKSENRSHIAEQFCDSHLSIESVSRELYHSQFHESDGILRMFDDWLDKMAICKHDLAEADQIRKDALILGAKVKAMREDRKKGGTGSSRWPQLGKQGPQTPEEAEEIIQTTSKEYEKLVQKFRDARKELEANVHLIVQQRFDTFDECLFRLMECQVDFYRSGAAFTDSFSKYIETYRQSCPREHVRKPLPTVRRKPPPPLPKSSENHRAPDNTTARNRRSPAPSSSGSGSGESKHHDNIINHRSPLNNHRSKSLSSEKSQEEDEEEGLHEGLEGEGTDHSDGEGYYEEHENDEEIKVPSEPVIKPRTQRLHSYEDMLNIGDSYAPTRSNDGSGAAPLADSLGMNGGRAVGIGIGGVVHREPEINFMDFHQTSADDLNPIHVIPSSQPAVQNDPLDTIFGKRTPTPKSRHSDVGRSSQSNGGMYGSPSPRGGRPRTFPKPKPPPSDKRFRDTDFDFGSPDQLLSPARSPMSNRKIPPRSAPSPRRLISEDDKLRHRQEKHDELRQKIRQNQVDALNEWKTRDDEATNLREKKLEKASELQYKLDVWEYKNGVRRNIRTLLSSLHTVIWANSGWDQVSLSGLTSAKNVKNQYRRVLLIIHPDKSSDKNAHTQALAERLFQAINTSYGEFQQTNEKI